MTGLIDPEYISRCLAAMATADQLIRWPASRKEVPQAALEAHMLLSRIRGLFGSIRLLVDADRAVEAQILSRPLFEDSLRLCYFARASARRREALYLFRMTEFWSDFRGKYSDLRRELGLSEMTPAQLAMIDERAADVANRATRLAIAPKGYPSTKDLALKFRLKDDFWAYAISHDAVHGSRLGTQVRLKFRPGNEADIAERVLESWYVASVVLSSTTWALRGITAGAEALEHPTDDLETLLAEVGALSNEFDDDAGSAVG